MAVPLAGLVISLAIGGCASIGERRIARPAQGVDRVTNEKGSPVVLIVLEGVRRDAFKAYLDGLKNREYEPEWTSGLSLLRQSQFKLAQAELAEATFPPLSLVSNATIVTGAHPGAHGLVDTSFIATRQAGSGLKYRFDTPFHAAGFWTDAVGGALSPQAKSTPQSLLTHPSWLELLGRQAQVSTAYSPFGYGTTQSVPENRTGGTLGMLDSEQGRLAVPLLDRASSLAMERALLKKPDLMVVHFRQAAQRSRHQRGNRCASPARTVLNEQAAALKDIDALLYRPLRRFRLEMPEVFERTLFMVVGTHGVGDSDKNSTRAPIDEDKVSAQLIAQSDTEMCAERIEAAFASGTLVTLIGAGSAQVRLAPCHAGQCQDEEAILACLGKAGSGLTANTPWVAATVWQTQTSGLRGGSSGDVEVSLSAQLSKGLPAYRRKRMVDKLKAAYSEQEGRGGTLTLYRLSPWRFSSKEHQDSAYAAPVGGLNGIETGVPFLFAGKMLDDTLEAALRTASIELTDIGPTVYQVLGIPAPLSLRSPPILQWTETTPPRLSFNRANRAIRPASLKTPPRLNWAEDADSVTLVFSEDSGLWPPAELKMTFDGVVYIWDGDNDRFLHQAPCTVRKKELRRTWSCAFPINRREIAGRHTGEVQRTPGPDSDAPLKLRKDFSFKPDTGARLDAQLVCADANQTRIRLGNVKGRTHASITVAVAGPSSSRGLRQHGGGYTFNPGVLRFCDASGPPCIETPPEGASDFAMVRLPSFSSILRERDWSLKLATSEPRSPAHSRIGAMQSRISNASGPILDSIWIEMDACRGGTPCERQFLATAAEYRTAASKGCAP